jgi:hypothetical protein
MKHAHVSLALSATATAVLAATTLAPAVAAAPPSHDYQSAKASSAKYHSVEQAARDGYTAPPPGAHGCVSSPKGVMGFHYTNNSIVDRTVDPLQPEVLLYVPEKNGGRRLVGVEYVVVDADQNLNTDDDRPSLFGQPFDGPMPGHVPGMPVHYDLHVWFWADNPNGTFAQFNPSLSC